MPRKKKAKKKVSVENYKHDSAKRKNIPTAKIAGEGKIPRVPKAKYSYSAHLSPELRFDSSGQSDRIDEIVEKAASGTKLTSEEAEILRGLAANASQPWLEWSGKKEEHDRGVLEVEPVALHIHERVSANAIIRAAKREDVQADLFADPQQEYKEAIQFYQHDVEWANRLILGDSLEVMSSLVMRENLAGKVQMIFIDPPYGIKFSSNFQSEVGKRDVKERDTDLTRELEMVKAYRDTWHLGVHSYLSYLRDRLLVARELLATSGSIFVQIGDDNLHRVKLLMDEVFGAINSLRIITVAKTAGMGSGLIPSSVDYLLWYARDRDRCTTNNMFREKVSAAGGGPYRLVEDDRIYRIDNLTSPNQGVKSCLYSYTAEGQSYSTPSSAQWKTTRQGMERLHQANRLQFGSGMYYKRFLDDFPVKPLNNLWQDTGAGGFVEQKWYVVQTNAKIIARCMLMTTNPGDLVIDPTCGSGTTAFVAEQWGRRWITIDSSRVSLSTARQRLLTAKFDHYSVANESANGALGKIGAGIDPSANFVYKSVPHITLSSIARNQHLDPIFAKHERVLDELLIILNRALETITEAIRNKLAVKFAEKLQNEGLRAASNSDCRRMLLPGTTMQQIESAFTGKPKLKARHVRSYADMVPPNGRFEHWNVPFDSDIDWPQSLSNAVNKYREASRAKMREVNACINSNADQEVLVDQPEIAKDVIRVSGPFTVEGVRPEELSLDEQGKLFDPTPNEWEVNDGAGYYAQNVSAYIDRMLQLIQQDGVTFPNNEHREFAQLDQLDDTDSTLHAEALWLNGDEEQCCNIAIAFGPQFGPVTAEQVEDLIRASRRYDELVIAGFSFDGAAQAVIQESENPRLKIHMAHIRPDVSPGMDGLLKDSPKSQLFSVFGQPEINVRSIIGAENGEVEVELLGVDIYSPLTGEITSSGADKVAAWFLDSDYDGRCFCITQAFFPNQKAWDKIAKALGSSADADAFAAYDGTVSVPFEPGQHQRIAVKVIDPRGNEVMAIRSIKELS